ncbi:cytochrome b561 domain-containing protein [Pseudomonas sp. PA15(2017)]|uniref:cytochrome b561 domain-containing protein n=1 Tax=Pseudomonas sp. PA15(2017) TaxID=1932111 RepID=UPI000AFA12B2|nr:cytochrome b561 domain-containing protein [Pseudomonas sp. PA15(2017)]
MNGVRWIAGLGLALFLCSLAGWAVTEHWDWLRLPLSGSDEHRIDMRAAWHGRVMVVSWSVMLPLGVLAARYFKVMPGQGWPAVLDNKRWWRMHLWLQVGGSLAGVLGVLLVLGMATRQTTLAQWHALCGWLVMLCACVQLVSGFLRGSKGGPTCEQWQGDHYQMTSHRVRFERLHKSIGWLALLLALAATLIGITMVDAPRWMALSIAAWWAALFMVGLLLQRAGRCIDTYQAIWGPAPTHPGNRRRPIGWGIRRLSGD